MATPGTPGPSSSERPDADGERTLTTTERAEYERLRAGAGLQNRRLRIIGASLVFLLVFLLAPLSVVAVWMHSEVLNTDRYVQTVAPLATDPAVQDAVTDRLTSRVVSSIDVDQVTAALADTLARNGAPPIVVDHAHALAGTLKDALTNAVRRVVQGAITSDLFAQTWQNANRRAHAAVVKVLTGEGNSAIQAKGDTVVLDIGTVVDKVQHQLVDAGFQKAAKIPDVDRQIVLLKSDELRKTQNGMRLLDILGTWLPLVTIVLAGLGVWLAPSHRAGFMAAGVGVGVTMAVLLVGLAIMRQRYLDSVPPGIQPQAAAAAIYDTLVRFLRNSTRTVLVIAIITVLAGYLYGPGRGARAIRAGTSRATTATGRTLARTGLRTGAAGQWLQTHQRWTTGIIIGAGVLGLALWNHPTPGSVALILCIVIIALALLAILAATGTQPTPAKRGGHLPNTDTGQTTLPRPGPPQNRPPEDGGGLKG